jgi:UPF0755 protein
MAAAAGVVVLVGIAIWLNVQFGAPAPGSRARQLFTVNPGATATQVGVQLERQGLVRDAWLFALWSRVDHLDSRLRTGVYVLSPSMPLARVIAILSQGDILQYRVTIPEGFTVQEAVDRLAAAHVATRRALDRAIREGLPGLIPPSAALRDPVEGFLFPDTYSFPAGMPARRVVLTMWDDFLVRTQKLRAELPKAHLTLWSWVTLASIVQAEYGYAPDAPKIAAVFDNRLHIGMKLQSDATVRYALDHPVVGPLTDQDLRVASPYNTYLHQGLPPGPIDNPGLVALAAVLHPARVPYLFFVAMPNGHSLFATTYAQHEQNVARVQAMTHH